MNLHDQIAGVCALPHGWCTEIKAQTLAALVIGTRPETIVEIGIWSGKSLLPMALACQEIGHGRVIGIDPYEPQASAEGQNDENAIWWTTAADHQAMLEYFLNQVQQRGLQNIISLIRKRSDDVTPPENIGLLHVDGNHGAQAIRDVQRFAPSVRDGGFIVLDDLTWEGGAVLKSIDSLINAGCTELFRIQTPPNDWGVFQKLS